MRDRLRTSVVELVRRLRRLERREVRHLQLWLETTENFVHLSTLVLVPLLVGAVTMLSNSTRLLSFLLYPPLASGTYTLFADPRGKYASPLRFVVGLTAGAMSGWLALELSARFWYHTPPSQLQIHAGAAALGIFVTGVVCWMLEIEEPAAFSTALLVLATDASQFAYVVTVALSSSFVAVVFLVWREKFYHERARYLYQSTKGDDHVLVPMRGPDPEATAILGARLAAAHDAGKVVLLDLITDAEVADAETELQEDLATDGGQRTEQGDEEVAAQRAAARVATDLESQAAAIRTRIGVPCEVVVASEGTEPARTVIQTAHETNCDLIATSYETDAGSLSQYIHTLFRGDVDVLVHRSCDGRTRWKHVMVPVRKAGDVAHEMLDFAARLSGRTGRVAVCHCIEAEENRHHAEAMLRDLVETVSAAAETRISRSNIATFLTSNAPSYDLVIIGASQDRSAASRFISRPTFERVQDLDTDVVVVDRNYAY